MRRKKLWITGLSVFLVLALIAGGVAVFVQRGNGKVAKVIPVSMLMNTGMDESMTTSGYVQTAQSQEIFLDTTTQLKEVMVEQGQSVKVGDPILAYDSTLLELNLERQKLSLDSAQLYLQLLAQKIDELRATPASPASSTTTGRSLPGFMTMTSEITVDSEANSNSEESSAIEAGEESQTTENSSAPTEDSKPNEESSKPEESLPPEESSEPGDESSLPEEPVQPPDAGLSGSGEGTIESPYEVIVSEDHKELTQAEWETLRGKVVRFSMEENGQEAYAIVADLTKAPSLAEGETFSLQMERRIIRDTVAILTLLQPSWPCVFEVQYALGDAFSTENLMLHGVTQAEVALPLTVNEQGIVSFTLEAGGIYLLTSEKTVIPEPEPEPDPEPEPEPEPEPNIPEEPEIPALPEVQPGGHTREELDRMIAELETEYTERSINIKLDKIEYQRAERKLEDATVKSKVNGTVRSIGDPNQLMGSPYIVLTATEGYYVTGTMDELMLEQVKAGQSIVISSWMTGMTYTGTITEISDYPETNGAYSYIQGNPNVSFYRFTAYIDETEGLSNGEGVNISIQGDQKNGESFYLSNMYIRTEGNQAYVMKRGEDGRLVKQPITKGRGLQGYYTEVLEGLSAEDYIAFPYGNAAKEGLETEIDERYNY